MDRSNSGNRKQRRAAAKQSGTPPDRPQRRGAALFAAAVQHHQAGRWQEAESLYRQLLAIDPDNATTLHLLGVLAHQAGRPEIAVELIGKAIAVNGNEPAFHSNLGNALKEQGKLDEAVSCYRRSLALKSDYAGTHNNLGIALHDQGRLRDAVLCYERALALKPDYVEAHSNLGATLQDQGKLDEAVACQARALALDPTYAEAHFNLANILKQQGKLEQAAASYGQALTLKPDYFEARCNLGLALLALGDIERALLTAEACLRESETVRAKLLFGKCLAGRRFARLPQHLSPLVGRALSEAWMRPSDLVGAAIALLADDPCVAGLAARLSDAPQATQNPIAVSDLAGLGRAPLLACLLRATPVSDIALERLLTACRSALLRAILDADSPSEIGEPAFNFCCALAEQCFINEYVFACTQQEQEHVARLCASLAAALRDDQPIAMPVVVAVAAYVPLLSLPGADKLLRLSWPAPLRALLEVQIQEPLAERADRADIPVLTTIDDDVSSLVRQQYEENPYPRWTKPEVVHPERSIDDFMQTGFPRAPYRALNKRDLDILIAGCGTGQHPIIIARMFPAARVLAVDLSLSSLAYARRKTRELGLENVAYAQADLLRLSDSGRKFDIIHSVGVLHHLADPIAGMRALASSLNPGGLFLLGLYSELARQDVVAVRAYAAEHGYGARPDDIRRCRQDLIALRDDDLRKKVTNSPDFASISGCRDLLFHVQEHRFSLPDISRLVDSLEMRFLGFDLDPALRKQFSACFPAVATETDLRLWHIFESENPDTFRGMYRLWLQRPAD
jgi:tetratricopeptide (TPR) repeat protein/SAM-dependent methyltransferase